MDCGGVLDGKRRLFGFLKIFKLDLLGTLSGRVAPDAIDRDAMRYGVEPRAQRARVFELADAVQHLDPYVLKHVEPDILTARQCGRVIKQRTLHDGDQIFECAHIARLATERYPLIASSIFVIHGPSLIMSKEECPRFNLDGGIVVGA